MQTKHRAAIALPLFIFALVLAGCSGGVANPEGWASPVFDNGTTYAFQRKDSLTAIDQATGNVKWTFPDDNKAPQEDIDLGSVYGTPQLVDGFLYFGTYEGDVISVNADSGDLAWLADLDESIVGAVAVADGLVATGTTEGNVFVMNAENGSAAANWPAKGLDLGGPIWGPAIADEGTLYIATMRGVVRAYDLVDATTKWEADFKTDGAIADLALLEDGRLAVPSLDRHVYFLNSEDGSEVNRVKLGDWVWGVPAVAPTGRMILTDISGDVYAFDEGQTEPAWVYSTENRLKASPTVINGTVVVADRSPAVHFLDINNGQRLRDAVAVETGGTIRANPTVVDNFAYFITTSGHIMKADAERNVVTEELVGRYRP